MRGCCLRLSTWVFALLVFGSACACPGNPVPVHLLGRNAYKQEVNFREYLEVVEVVPSPDSELLDIRGLRESLFIVDKNRNYFRLSVLDGIIEWIAVDDPCLIAERGIRVGDSLPRVMAVYPDAKFRQGAKLVESGIIDILANNGKIEFLFSGRINRDLLRSGYKFDLNDEVLKGLKVSSIIIHW